MECRGHNGHRSLGTDNARNGVTERGSEAAVFLMKGREFLSCWCRRWIRTGLMG
jgi:hypothetical protein